MIEQDLAALARLHGIGDSYLDFRGERRSIRLELRVAILRAMGIDVDDARAVSRALSRAAAAEPPPAIQPGRCHQPAFLSADARPWGICLQLYALRSELNWGIGDFADLARLVRQAAALGADFLGLNPLHALFAAEPAQCSPYSPSSRHCLNVLYLSVTAIADLQSCPEAQQHVSAAGFQRELARLRSLELVDYEGVARCKLEVLRLLFDRFRREELAVGTSRGQAFQAYADERALTVGRHALFEALDGHMRRAHGAVGGWPTWAAEYRDPGSEAVAEFARAEAIEVSFHTWLQWLAESQLAAAGQTARDAGMRIGLYGDYAVGASPGGSETWADGQAYCHEASIGAPPDALALKGQDWGLPPPDPAAMLRDDCRQFRQLMRDNMRHFAALRLDHVMSLYRLWWVPRGRSATDGGYVHYPVTRLFDALALESRRNECLVVGEDLGTVPAEVGEAMADSGVYGCTVLYFERTEDESFKAPAAWRREALASVTTHDLPTLRAWWEGSDIGLRSRLGMYPPGQRTDQLLDERERDRRRLVSAMADAGVRPDWPVERFEPEFAAAVYAFLAETASALVAVQAEDLLAMVEPVNVPGTSAEHANWRRKLSGGLADLLQGAAARPLLDRLRQLRPR